MNGRAAELDGAWYRNMEPQEVQHQLRQGYRGEEYYNAYQDQRYHGEGELRGQQQAYAGQPILPEEMGERYNVRNMQAMVARFRGNEEDVHTAFRTFMRSAQYAMESVVPRDRPRVMEFIVARCVESPAADVLTPPYASLAELARALEVFTETSTRRVLEAEIMALSQGGGDIKEFVRKLTCWKTKYLEAIRSEKRRPTTEEDVEETERRMLGVLSANSDPPYSTMWLGALPQTWGEAMSCLRKMVPPKVDTTLMMAMDVYRRNKEERKSYAGNRVAWEDERADIKRLLKAVEALTVDVQKLVRSRSRSRERQGYSQNSGQTTNNGRENQSPGRNPRIPSRERDGQSRDRQGSRSRSGDNGQRDKGQRSQDGNANTRRTEQERRQDFNANPRRKEEEAFPLMELMEVLESAKNEQAPPSSTGGATNDQ